MKQVAVMVIGTILLGALSIVWDSKVSKADFNAYREILGPDIAVIKYKLDDQSRKLDEIKKLIKK